MDWESEMSAASLRPMTEDDVAAVVSLERRYQKAPWSEENIRSELAKPYCLFLVTTDDETDSKVMGYIVFWLMFDECHILNVLVDEKVRGLGLAKRMIRIAVTEAIKKDIKKILLEVRKSNAAAIGLYQKSGFVITHVRKAFYSDGEDAYQMALYLNDPGGGTLRF
ncbi:MAG: ribosomal protein S18-alanine N-acetyltransferase [Bdellovibrionota bacterium]